MQNNVIGEVTEEEVRYYRKLYKKNKLTIKQIALAKGMSYHGVYAFLVGKTWRSIPGAPSIFKESS